jgi:hypothetical protein
MARQIVAADATTDNSAMSGRTLRHIALAVLLLAVAAACSPLPNPNPSSPANSLGGVGSPNQLPIASKAP